MLCVRFNLTASALNMCCHVYTVGLVISAVANTLLDVIFIGSLLSTGPSCLSGMWSLYDFYDSNIWEILVLYYF